ncbi:MAG: phosphate ABC transporter substrate-binding protein [Leptolyngbya sp. SIOISBB]|nr:phosphate ABC transporter substrate-binding protein [Leptolyngbya sp. SIOISBB]
MSHKNETPILVASLLITAGLLGGGYWWLTRDSGVSLPGLGGNSSQTASPNPATSLPASTGAQFNNVQDVPAGFFSYGGSTTWAPVRGVIDPVMQQTFPAFQLRYTDPVGVPSSSGSGIAMLLNNQLSFSQSSRSLNSEEQQTAQQQGYSLKEIPVALEGLAIAVGTDLPVDGITLTQLRDIYLGNLTNWSQLGGPTLPIVPISRPTDGGTVEFFIDAVLGGAGLSSRVTIASTTTEALRLVDTTPGAIYYASAPEVVGQCTVKPIAIGRQPGQLVSPYAEPYIPPESCPAQRNQINSEALRSGTYPLTRRLFVVIREDNSQDQQAGEAYANLLLTQQGQQLLSEAGFVAIR